MRQSNEWNVIRLRYGGEKPRELGKHVDMLMTGNKTEIAT
jgi:hypothetical protein